MKINIVGSILGTTGYDNHTRQLFNALYELNPDIKLDVPLPPDYVRWVTDSELNAITRESRVPDVIISIMTPPLWRISMGDKSKHFVGYCVFEGDKIPEYWMEYLVDERVDQIWVPSQHTKDAIINTIGEGFVIDKIKIVPHGVDLNIFKPQDGVTVAQGTHASQDGKFDSSSCDKFTFICNKGWRGGFEDRGGVAYVIKAYCEEFSEHENVCLFLKLNPAYIHPSKIREELDKLNLTKSRPEIKLNFDSLPFKELPKIYNQGDIYVCAQRADAFNLPGLEAMGCGLPTIQTNYGGQTDYVTEENGYLIKPIKLEIVKGDIQYEEIKWAVPDVDYLKVMMRHCFKCQEEVKEKGKKAIIDAQKWTWRISAQKALGFLNKLI